MFINLLTGQACLRLDSFLYDQYKYKKEKILVVSFCFSWPTDYERVNS